MSTDCRQNLAPSRIVLAVLAIFLFCFSATFAQELTDEPTQGASPEELEVESREEETFEEVTDAERIIRLEQVVYLDKGKLEELKADILKRQDLFNMLGKQVILVTGQLEEQRLTLQEMDASVDPEERSDLEENIADLEVALGLYKNQSEVSFTSEKTVRAQILALEKQIEREERSLKALREGGKFSEDLAAPPLTAPATSSAPARGGSISPMLPIPSGSGTTAHQDVSKGPRLSAAQIAAAREANRLEVVADIAERDLLEFVKRTESLKKQIELEKVLLQAAHESSENLEDALGKAEASLEKKIAEEAGQREIRDMERSITLIEGLLVDARNEIEEKTLYIETLERRHDELGPEGETIARDVEQSRQAAESALRHSSWLASPLHPSNIVRWGQDRLPRMLLVVGAVILLLLILKLTVRRVARTFVRHSRGSRAAGTNRADTLAFSFKGASTVIIVTGGTLLILQEGGLDLNTVLGGAAILGIAIAFGAQNLMRDYFTGFMILLEDQYEIGDLVTIGAITGRVERVNMRVTVLRDIEGRVHFIPNGEIKSVTNRTYVWGRALVEIPIAYHENIDHAMEVLMQAAKSLQEDEEWGEFVTADPNMMGVDKFTESGVILKLTLQTQPDKIFPVRRELLRRIKNKFDEEGIQISVPHRLLVQQGDKP